jgi:hypothetical protein
MTDENQRKRQHQKTTQPMLDICRKNQLINQKRVEPKNNIYEKEELFYEIEYAQWLSGLNNNAIIAIKPENMKTEDYYCLFSTTQIIK